MWDIDYTVYGLNQSGSVIVQLCGLSWTDQSSGRSAGTQQTEECVWLDPPLYSPLFSCAACWQRNGQRDQNSLTQKGQTGRQERASLLETACVCPLEGVQLLRNMPDQAKWSWLRGEMLESFKGTHTRECIVILRVFTCLWLEWCVPDAGISHMLLMGHCAQVKCVVFIRHHLL